MSVMAMYSPTLIHSPSLDPQRIFKQGLISHNLKCCTIRSRALELEEKVEESINAVSLANWRSMSSHRNTMKELAYFFVGSGECLSNRFKMTGFKFLNVEKCLKMGDFFLKSLSGLACVRLSESTGTGWLVNPNISLLHQRASCKPV